MGLGESKPTPEKYHQNGNNRARHPTGGQHHYQVKRDRPRPTEPPQPTKPNRNHQSHNNVKAQKPSHAPQPSHRQQQPKVVSERNGKGHHQNKKFECNVCGHEGHTGDRCYHRHQTCQICFQPGHLRSVCRQKTHHPESVFKPKDGGNRARNNY